tara:strand:- start:2175 stop:2564 length:390 start_codon:yes stop_codon:yes gene_type:complete
MTVNISTQQLLSDGKKWYAYSGLKQGDISVPAVVPLVEVENVGLRDSILIIQPYYSLPAVTTFQEGLGVQVLFNDIIVYEFKSPDGFYRNQQEPIHLFIERQTNLKVLSLNTSGNNSQSRGANVLGYFC